MAAQWQHLTRRVGPCHSSPKGLGWGKGPHCFNICSKVSRACHGAGNVAKEEGSRNGWTDDRPKSPVAWPIG